MYLCVYKFFTKAFANECFIFILLIGTSQIVRLIILLLVYMSFLPMVYGVYECVASQVVLYYERHIGIQKQTIIYLKIKLYCAY